MSASRAPLVVCVAGGSGSGKSVLAEHLSTRLDGACARIAHDWFYCSVPEGGPLPNFDHPDALDNAALVEAVRRMRNGEVVVLPRYDFSTHRQRPESEWVQTEPQPVIVVEGILVLAVPDVRGCADLAVFVDAPADIRLVRRIRRDAVARGRDVEDVLTQYETSVRPMHEALVEPSKAHADLVVNGLEPATALAETVAQALSRLRPSDP